MNDNGGMRSIWSGSISFGLINIPVKIYSASEERKLNFKMLDKHEHQPIRYRRVTEGSEQEVAYDDIVKAYEYQKGNYVIITDEDFEKAAPKKTKTIDIVSFVREDEVPSTHIDKPYYLEPDKKSAKAYVLLREALRRSKKIGVATWVLRNKEHLAMVRPEGKALMLVQLRYQDELREPDELDLPGESEFTKRELEMALSLIKQLEEHFDPAKFKDTYSEELYKIIERKAKGQTIRIAKGKEPVPTEMRDLMKALKKSLAQEKRKRVSA